MSALSPAGGGADRYISALPPLSPVDDASAAQPATATAADVSAGGMAARRVPWTQTASKVLRYVPIVLAAAAACVIATAVLVAASPLLLVGGGVLALTMAVGRRRRRVPAPAAAAPAAAPSPAAVPPPGTPLSGGAEQADPMPAVEHSVDAFVSQHATESFELRKALVAAATQRIDFCGIYAGGPPFQEFLDVVEERMQKVSQLQVRIMVSPNFLERADKRRLKGLEQAYAGRFAFVVCKQKVGWEDSPYTRENHVKLLVADDYFTIGGTGIIPATVREDYAVPDDKVQPLAAYFHDRAFRDTDLVGHGSSMADEMVGGFERLWSLWQQGTTAKALAPPHYQTAKGYCELFHNNVNLVTGAKVKFLLSTKSAVDEEDPILEELCRLVDASEGEIQLGSFVFSPPQALLDKIQEARRRGVHVSAYLNKAGWKHHPVHLLLSLQSRQNYDQLDEVYEYAKEGQLYHKKVFLFDAPDEEGQLRRKAMIGSCNLSVKSLSPMGDNEAVVVIDDEGLVGQLEEGFAEDRQRSVHLTGQALHDDAQRYRLVGQGIQKVLGPLFI